MIKKQPVEKAYVIGVVTPKVRRYEALESFEELKSLARTSGAEIIHAELIDIRHFNPPTFMGQGKVLELLDKIIADKPDLILIDYDLTPIQNRNLESTWKTRVLDRTGLILDIFASRAQSKEGKLQVELAQYQYLLPRLVGQWTHFSKQRGGHIGLRGPGETQLEVDRRRVRERIIQLKKNLKRVSTSREIHRKKRQSVPIPTVAFIGYTNAGKSTLFNSLTDAAVLAEDKLFATLDPKTKKLRLPSGQKVLVSDTVGFIRNLPHQLVDSFKSTFEEMADADLLVHVIDVSHPDRLQQIQTVEKVLQEIGMHDRPVLKVMSKVDALDGEDFRDNTDVIHVSGLTGYGLDTFLEKLEDKLSTSLYKRMQLLIPHNEGRLISNLYTHGCVLSTLTTESGAVFDVNLPPKWQNIYQRYQTTERLSVL